MTDLALGFLLRVLTFGVAVQSVFGDTVLGGREPVLKRIRQKDLVMIGFAIALLGVGVFQAEGVTLAAAEAERAAAGADSRRRVRHRHDSLALQALEAVARDSGLGDDCVHLGYHVLLGTLPELDAGLLFAKGEDDLGIAFDRLVRTAGRARVSIPAPVLRRTTESSSVLRWSQ